MTSRSDPGSRGGALVALGLLAACAPTEEPPEAEAPCEIGFVLDEDEATCVPENCGVGLWGSWDRSGDVVHVAPWGADDGDGTEGSPYASIQHAADRAAEEGAESVALSEGTWTEDVFLADPHDGLMLHGRCSDRTLIEGVDAGGNTVFVRGEVAVRLRDLAITGPRYGMVVEGSVSTNPSIDARRVAIRGAVAAGAAAYGNGARLELEDCVVEDTVSGPQPAWGRGIEIINGGRLVARDLVIRNVIHDGLLVVGPSSWADLSSTQVLGVRPHAEGGTTSGVTVFDGASLVAEGLLIDDTIGAGLAVYDGGATVELRSSTIRGTQRRPDMLDGPGILVFDGGSVTGVALEVLENEGAAVLAGGAGCSLVLEDSRVADTRLRDGGVDGRGLSILEGCRLEGTRLEVSSNSLVGIQGAGLGTEVILVDSVVSDTQPDGTGDGGSGLVIEDRATLVATGLEVLDNHTIGLAIQDEGTTVSLEDSLVAGTLPSAAGDDGLGISATGGASLQASRVRVEDNHTVGLGLFDGAQAVLLDVEVRGTGRSPVQPACHGVAVSSGASLQAEQLVIEDNVGVGLAGGTGGTVHLVDSRVAGTRPYANGEYGRGVGMQDGSTLSVQGLVLERNHEIGLVATGIGTSVTGSGVQALDIQPLPSGQYGRGLGVAYGASLDLSDVEVLRCTEAGVWASGEGTTLTLRDALVEGTISTGALSAGSGVAVSLGAEATLIDVRLAHNDGPGLWVNAEGAVSGQDVVSASNGFAGAVVYASTLSLQGGEIIDAVARPGRAGGVGILSNFVFVPSKITLQDVRFAGHRYGGLYLRGEGSYEVRDCRFEDSGSDGPSTAGGVFATEGVEAWHEVQPTGAHAGLLIEGCSFSSLASDAIVLDRSSATVEDGSFSSLGGEQIVWQRCEGVDPPSVEGDTSEPCSSSPRPVEPLLEFHADTTETLAEE